MIGPLIRPLILPFLISHLTIHTCNGLDQFSYKELDSLTLYYYNQGKYKKCIPILKFCRQKAKKEYGIMHTDYATYNADLALVYDILGQYKLAIQHYQEAIDIQIKVLGENHPDYAKTITNLAGLYKDFGHFRKAESCYESALKIRREIYSANHPLYANTLNGAAGLYRVIGQFSRSEAYYKKSIKIFEMKFGKNHPKYANALNNLAILYDEMGYFNQAESLHLQALDIRKNTLGKQHPSYANSVTNLAYFYMNIDQYEESESLYLEGIQLKKQAFGTDHPSYANSLNNLAILYKSIGQFQDAEKLYLEALHIRKKVFGEKHSTYATCLNNLAALYMIQGKFNQAEILYKKAIKIDLEFFGPKNSSYIDDLHNLAELYKVTHKFKEAEALYLRVTTIFNKNKGTEHPDYIAAINNLAELYKKMDKLNEAWSLLSRGIQSFANIEINQIKSNHWYSELLRINYPSNQHIYQITRALSIIYELLEKEKSDSNNKLQAEIAQVDLQLLRKIHDSFTNEKDKLRILAANKSWLARVLSKLNLKSDFQLAFQLVELDKSVLLIEENKKTMAYQLGNLPDSLLQLERHLSKKQAEIEAQLLTLNSKHEKDCARVLLNETNMQIRAHKKQIEHDYPKFVQLKYQPNTPDINEIQNSLNHDEAIIEFAICDSSVYVFYLDQNNARGQKLPINSSELNDRIKTMRQVFKNYSWTQKHPLESYQNYIKSAFWCYKNLLEPVLNKKNNIKHLIIVPDEDLGHIPFESFLVQKASKNSINYNELHYVIQDFRISYHYSTSLWLIANSSTSPTNNGQMLAMAAQYDSQLDSATLKLRLPAAQRLRSKLSPLPGARHEVKFLEKNYLGYFGIDSLATELLFKQHADQYSIIHLAMHGLLNQQFPALSCLAFSESPDSTENNLLQAYEISKMELNADLVVLSACQTGYGKFEKGNGIASVARAFMFAGVPSLVVTLWQIHDESTSIIMQQFYKHLSKNANKAEALRQAKLAYIKKAKGLKAHPVYWSPFIQIGDNIPIIIKQKPNDSNYWIGGFILILICSILFYKHNRSKKVTT